MSRPKKPQSVEPQVAELVNGWLKSYGLDYRLEQETLNREVDYALANYASKQGGTGGNRPDVKLLLRDKKLEDYPVLIEYKGYRDRLEKLTAEGQVDNWDSKHAPRLRCIRDYAVNGAVHYANAILHYTTYPSVIAIGVTGYKNAQGEVATEIGVYSVSKGNLGMGQKVGEFSDLSFLMPAHFDDFVARMETLSLSEEELTKRRELREQGVEASLVRLNNEIYEEEQGLGENDRVYLVASSIIASLGVPGKVQPLEKEHLLSSGEKGNRDGDIMVRKISSFLEEKQIPTGKKAHILRTLENTLTTDNLNSAQGGETQLKRVFIKVVDTLGLYYKIGLTTDFTGKLFNEMYRWMGFSQDKLNDVVLTPSYVATLLVRLARVNADSYVWDFATGSAGLLVAAMNEMIDDAKRRIDSPAALQSKITQIKAEQMLGVELLANVCMLAILNMIMMGDGCSNIQNRDSLRDFDGSYTVGQESRPFPADAFVLNPPYSAPGNGMVFVEKALGMMGRGYAAIIIQDSAGYGKATEYNQRILKRHTLIASIKMPIDLFIGKSSVQTSIYVFRVGEAHAADEMVRFIDFSHDGYLRTNRRKAKCNLVDEDHAQERYQEVVDLVRFGRSKLRLLGGHEYIEDRIDPTNGNDWNFVSHVKLDSRPQLEDFAHTVKEHLAWSVSQAILRADPSKKA